MKVNFRNFGVVLFLCAIGFVGNVQAGDNFFYLRLEGGEKKVDSEKYQGTYLIFENNNIEGLSLGSKIITGNDGFIKLQPYVFKSVYSSWQLGVKYSYDSFGNEAASPSIRFKGKVWKIFTILDYARDFDLKDGKNNKNDVWLYTSTTNPKFNLGMEVWYYNFLNGAKYCHVRPIRFSYRWKANFFIMPNFCYLDGVLASRSVMVGMDFKF